MQNKRRTWRVGAVSFLTAAILTGCGGQAGHTAPGNDTNTSSPSQVSGNASKQTANNTVNRTTATTTPAPATTWPSVSVTIRGALPVPMEGVSLTADAHTVYAVGGYTGVYSVTSVTRIWPSVLHQATLPVRLHDAATGFVGGRLLVFGGGQNDSYNTVFQVTGTVGKVAGTLSSPLSDAVAVPWTQAGQTGILVIGGYDGQNFHRNVDFFVMNGGRLTSKVVFTLPLGVRYPAVAVTDGTVVIVGGKLPSGQDSSAVYRWTPAHGVQKVANLPYGIEKAALFGARQSVILAGGLRSSGQASRDVIAIRLTDGRLRTIAELPKPLYDMGYVQFGTSGFIAGGTDGSHISAGIEELSIHGLENIP